MVRLGLRLRNFCRLVCAGTLTSADDQCTSEQIMMSGMCQAKLAGSASALDKCDCYPGNRAQMHAATVANAGRSRVGVVMGAHLWRLPAVSDWAFLRPLLQVRAHTFWQGGAGQDGLGVGFGNGGEGGRGVTRSMTFSPADCKSPQYDYRLLKKSCKAEHARGKTRQAPTELADASQCGPSDSTRAVLVDCSCVCACASPHAIRALAWHCA